MAKVEWLYSSWPLVEHDAVSKQKKNWNFRGDSDAIMDRWGVVYEYDVAIPNFPVFAASRLLAFFLFFFFLFFPTGGYYRIVLTLA